MKTLPSPRKLFTAGFIARWLGMLFLGATHAVGGPGALDLTFGGTGKLAAGAGGGGCYAHAIVRQTDGKLVTAGSPGFALTRYNANGSLDTTFGTRGKTQTIIGTSGGNAQAMALLSGNKFLVAGFTPTGNAYAVSVARYNPDGSLDTTFGGGDGITELATPYVAVLSIVVQSDGKIVLLCANGIILIRFNADGTPDTSFGSNGMLTVTIPGYTSFSGSAMVLQGAKFMVAGTVYNGSTVFTSVTRLTATGALDASFGSGGTAVAPGAANSRSFPTSLALFSTSADDNRVALTGQYAVSISQSYRIAVWSFSSTNGAVDTAFGTGGRVLMGDDGSSAQGVAIGFSGLIASRLVLGTRDGHNNVQAVRLLLDGTLDTAFDGDGMAVGISVGNTSDEADAILVQPDNKVVIAGHAGSFAALFRFNSNGTADTGFDGDGFRAQDFGDAPFSHVSAVLPQADGKTVVAGDYALARFNADGSPDGTFGANGDGKSFHSAFQIRAAGLLADGRILVAGADGNAIYLARYSAGGVMDNVFGSNSLGTAIPTTYTVSGICGLIIQPNGTIIVGATAYTGGQYEFALVRFLAAGIWDANFGSAGVASYTAQGGGSGVGLACGGIARQPDGKLVATGYTYAAGGSGFPGSFHTVRFNADGTRDGSFGSGGVVTTADTLPDSLAVVVQPDGKIVIGGGTRNNGVDVITLLRYNDNGTLDPTFDGDGKVYTVAPGFGAELRELTLLPDGKIVASGIAATNSAETVFDFAVARYRPDGSLDPGFGNGGITTFDFGGGLDDEAYVAGVDRLGRVFAAGSTGSQFAVARLTGDPFATIAISRNATNGHFTLQGLASPDLAWSVRRTASLTGGYTPVGPVAPDAAGAWLYDAGVAAGTSAFYRLSVP